MATLVPTLLVLAAPFAAKRAPFRAATFATALTAGLSAVAVLLRATIALLGVAPSTSKLGAALHALVQLDLVSSAMLLLVSTLAIVVVRYSRTYLAGERGLDRYVRSLLMTLASVTMLVVSNHLVFLIGGWFAAGVFLHQLLMFYRTRRQAVIVAHKTFLLSRLADLFFVGSLAFLSAEVGSLRIDVVNAYAAEASAFTSPLHVATVLLVVGVLLKTAQVPFHGWVTTVMEAPTPVSALLHAGVVNIGGFVMIRLSPLMAHASIAQGMLVGFGLATAIIGSLVMTTRLSIKVVLAWSTIAQMGFMLMQCGLGVWHLALLHLLAHSFYKAHAFLTAGSVVSTWRGASLVQPKKPSLGVVAAAVLVLSVAAAPFYALFKLAGGHASPSLTSLALVLGLSFVPMVGRALAAGWRAFGLTALFTAGAAAAYFAGHVLFEEIVPPLEAGAASPFQWTVVVAGLGVLFVVQVVVQTSPSGGLARFLHPHLLSGLYIDDWFTRVTFRLWPPRVERTTAPSPSSIRPRAPLESRQW
ncbi:MAG: NADH-quinone oxidoreductase subunit L [Labilithrix sp.]|nr:NADH-quinone oxidoreductase subunit L [Labilithrix sp.]